MISVWHREGSEKKFVVVVKRVNNSKFQGKFE